MTTPTGILFYQPQAQPLSANGQLQAGAYAYFYTTGTLNEADVYSDGALTTPISQPVTANSAGVFPAIYLSPSTIYRVKLFTSGGSLIVDQDPYVVPGLPAASSIGAIIWPITAAETAAGITPNYAYAWGDVRRWGVVPNSSGAAAANTTALLAMVSNRSTSTFEGDIYFPNTTGTDTYYFSDFIDFLPGCHVDLQNCTLSFTKIGGAGNADSNSGFIFAIRDFTIENGTVIANYSQVGSSWTNAGNCLTFGNRGSDSQYFAPLYDSLLTVPMGNIAVRNMTLQCNHAVGEPVFMIGGLRNVSFENIVLDCGGNVPDSGAAFYYEFGWATDETVLSTRSTSHAHNMQLRNIVVQNVGTGTNGVTFNGAYSVDIDGLYGYGVGGLVTASPGESMFYRVWSGVDDAGAKRNLAFRNLVAGEITGTGVDITGAQSPAGGYLGNAWVASTAYVVNQTVINGSNWYVCTTGGTSAGSGGPTGTGSGINDNGVIWNYVPPSNETELSEFTLDGFAFNGLGAGTTGYGVRTSAGRATIRNGTIKNMDRGIVTETECTLFEISGVKVIASQSFGLQLGLTNNFYLSPRFATGTVRNCYIVGSGVGGNCAGIVMTQMDSLLIENCRIGYETAHDGFNESTQTNAVDVDSTSGGVICRGNYVGSTASSADAYVQVGATSSNGNTIEKAQGVQTLSGYWDSDLATISADRGAGTSHTLTPGVDYQVQLFNTALTGNVTLTLATGGPKGSKFRVVRTAASTGAYSISVGGLKSIPNSTAAFVDVEYDGNTWWYTGYGAL